MALHHTRTRRALALLTALLLTLAAACGDDDGSSNGGGDTPSDDAAGDSGDSGGGGTQGSCDGTSASGESPGNDSFSGTSAVAISLEGGKAYTVYIADWDLQPDDVSVFGSPEIPDDNTLFTVAVTAFNADVDALDPLEPGQVIEYTSEWEVLTFVVTATDADGTHGMSTNAEGTVTITGTGDSFCGSVTYTDDQKTISGTFEAPVKGA
jgi:hypothetical protein